MFQLVGSLRPPSDVTEAKVGESTSGELRRDTVGCWVKFVEVCLGDVRFRVTKHNNHLFLRLTFGSYD